MSKVSKFHYRNLNQPDDKRVFAGHGYLETVNVTPDIQIGRATLEPGWKWSEDVKPIAQTPSCQAEHNGYVVSGSLTIKMDDGQESVNLNAGDAFHIPPGHDAWVTGNQPCIVLDFTGVKEYAKKKEEKKAA